MIPSSATDANEDRRSGEGGMWDWQVVSNDAACLTSPSTKATERAVPFPRAFPQSASMPKRSGMPALCRGTRLWYVLDDDPHLNALIAQLDLFTAAGEMLQNLE